MSDAPKQPLPGYGAPDVETADPAYAEAPRWPTALGVVGIIYASLGFCLSVMGTVGLAFNERLQALSGIEPIPVPRELRLAGLLSVGIGVVLAAILMTGAIGLLRRRPGGARLMAWWAGLAVVTTVAMAVWNVRLQPVSDDMQAKIFAEQKRVMEKAGRTMPAWAGSSEGNKVLVYTMMAVPLVFPLITAFMLSSSRRQAQIRTWGTE